MEFFFFINSKVCGSIERKVYICNKLQCINIDKRELNRIKVVHIEKE